MPAVPGAHLILVHADLALASFETRFNAGARLDHARQFRQRRLFQLHIRHTRRREIILIAVAGILIGSIPRGTGLPRAVCALPKSVPRLPQRLAAGVDATIINKYNCLKEFTRSLWCRLA